MRTLYSEEKFFEVTSGKVNLSDPCYDTDTWCGAYNVSAKNGKWRCGVGKVEGFGKNDIRVAELYAHHIDHLGDYACYLKALGNDFGVDSGQFGIFDSSVYPSDGGDDDSFYQPICDITLSDEQFGVYNNQGVVSSTGYGDGGYNGFGAYDSDGNLIAFKIIFIGDDEEDPYDEEDEDEYEEDEEN